jgi:ATP-dependent Clp protease ATP-binding subunit ClpC
VITAQEEARGLAHNYVGTGHELLGLRFDQTQTAARVLNQFGITGGQVRERVVEIVSGGAESRCGGRFRLPRAREVLSSAVMAGLAGPG